MRSPRPGRAVPTRVLLVCATLAALHAIVQLTTLPVTGALAAAAPPAYALVASLHSLMPFLARRLTGVRGSATLTSGIAGVFVAAGSSIGVIALIPLLLTGAVIDTVVWNSDAEGRRSEPRYLMAAVVAGIVLWAVSLVVFSPDHLTPTIIGGVLLGRIVGELVIVTLSRALASALGRAGVGRTLRPTSPARPYSPAQPNGSGEIGSS